MGTFFKFTPFLPKSRREPHGEPKIVSHIHISNQITMLVVQVNTEHTGRPGKKNRWCTNSFLLDKYYVIRRSARTID